MLPLLGGFRILRETWVSSTGYRVDFETTYDDRLYQLYAGRTWIGATRHVDETTILAPLKPSLWGQTIQLVAVDPVERETDYGALLPPRAYNRARLAFTTAGWTDAEHIRITRGSAPGDAPDPDELVENVEFDTNRAYSHVTDPLPGSGEWNFAVQGIDQAGNLGDELELTAAGVLSPPPDVALVGGRRLSASVEEGVLSVSFEWR